MTSEHEERRRFLRIVTDKAVQIEAANGDCRGRVVDISLRGLLVHCDDVARLPKTGETARAHIQLDDETCCIDVEGTVAHVEGAQLGLRHTSMDLDSAARLRRLVELNLADPVLLERELIELIRNQPS